MSFEPLVWIIILLIGIGAAISRPVRRASKFRYKNPADKGPGWRERLRTIVSQLEEMAEKGAPTDGTVSASGEMSWERIEPALEKSKEVEKKSALPEADSGAVTPAPGRVKGEGIKPARESRKTDRIDPVPMKFESGRPKPRGAGKKSPSRQFPIGAQDLRKAVIWSEILAPPLALRDR
jgi:hypothetical protein